MLFASGKLTTSYVSSPHNKDLTFQIQRIDDLLRPDHSYLEKDDECFFYGEYTAGKGFSYSDVNQLIINFKKEMAHAGKPGWGYKASAIRDVAQIIKGLREWPRMQEYAWVPIPPSVKFGEPEHDDRLIQVLDAIRKDVPNFDFRDIIDLIKSRTSAHNSQNRPKPDEHISNFDIRKDKVVPEPKVGVIVFDDVLTSGSGFKAVKRVVNSLWPNKPVYGFFVARVVRDADVSAMFEKV